METIDRSTPQAPSTPERFSQAASTVSQAASTVSQAASTVGHTVARAGAALPELPGGLAELIRRHPLPSLMVGLGLGFLLGRTCVWSGEESTAERSLDQSEAGYPDALIQCLSCGEMVRQADMVSHSTTCRGTGRLSHGGSTS